MLRQESCSWEAVLLELVSKVWMFHQQRKNLLDLSLPQSSMWHHTLLISQSFSPGSLKTLLTQPFAFLLFKLMFHYHFLSLLCSVSRPRVQSKTCRTNVHEILGKGLRGNFYASWKLGAVMRDYYHIYLQQWWSQQTDRRQRTGKPSEQPCFHLFSSSCGDWKVAHADLLLLSEAECGNGRAENWGTV